MGDLDERQIESLTVAIDRALCVGFGDCVEAAPDAFELDDEGIVVFRAPERLTRELLIAACRTCPVDALTVVDEAGTQIVP